MKNEFNLMLITNNCDIASYCHSVGVNRIFVDLEINGKLERQGHLDTVISKHSESDISSIRKAVKGAELLVRLNPLHSETEREIESAIERGADIIMQPMFRSAGEVDKFSKIINGRVKFIPLLETAKAYQSVSEIVKVEGITEMYIGLNDLHLDMGCSFMFELLSNGVLDEIVEKISARNIPFGFGGIARLGVGILPAEMILTEHARLGSSSVILSRAFHNKSKNLSELNQVMDFELEIKKLMEERNQLLSRNQLEILQDKSNLNQAINNIVKKIHHEKNR